MFWPRFRRRPIAFAFVCIGVAACGRSVRVGSIASDGGNGSDAANDADVAADAATLSTANQVATSVNLMCAIARGGLHCQGYNLHGVLGETLGSNPLQRVEGIENAVDVVLGRDFACVRHSDGGVSCLGANWAGQLGRGDTMDSRVPQRIAGLQASALFGAGDGACAIDAGGTLWCWGDNEFGEISPSSMEPAVLSPTVVQGLAVRKVALGFDHACVLTTANRVRCYGRNADGELGDGTQTNRREPVEPLGLGETIDIAASASPFLSDNTCALRENGTVLCWGDDTTGGIGDGFTLGQALMPTAALNVGNAISLLSGGKTMVAYTDQGPVLWGHDGPLVPIRGQEGDHHEPILMPELGRFDSLALSIPHACGLEDGRFYCWGRNTLSQFSDEPEGAMVPITEYPLP